MIEAVFEKRQGVKQYPIAMNYLEIALPTQKSLQFVFSVPKKRFKRAVDRNRIKRLLREAVRHTKWPLEEFLMQNQRQIAIFIVYLASEEMDYQTLLTKVDQLFQKLKHELEKKEPKL